MKVQNCDKSLMCTYPKMPSTAVEEQARCIKMVSLTWTRWNKRYHSYTKHGLIRRNKKNKKIIIERKKWKKKTFNRDFFRYDDDDVSSKIIIIRYAAMDFPVANKKYATQKIRVFLYIELEYRTKRFFVEPLFVLPSPIASNQHNS